MSADTGEPVDPSAPVLIYEISKSLTLTSTLTVLPSESGGELNNSLTGVYSVHDVGGFLLIDYPHIFPRYTLFVPKDRPRDFRIADFNPSDLITDRLNHVFFQDMDGKVCVLWILSQPFKPDGNGGWVIPKATLQSVCDAPGASPTIESDQWDQFEHLELDGNPRYLEVAFLTKQGSKLVELILGGATIPLGAMPPPFDSSSESRGVMLEAASRSYLIIGISDMDRPFNRNAHVFVRSSATGKWRQLPVLAVAPSEKDSMYYRLFGDWLVTSASAKLLANSQVNDTADPDVLTVVETGKLRTDLGIEATPRTASGAAALPSRRITLWNLADNRRIDLALPEDDSEIVHVFDNHQVLLRIHDKLFFAEIEGSRLTGYKLAAFDSAIPMVHWAWYANAAVN